LIKSFKIKKEEIDLRLDKWLKKKFSTLNQSFIEKNIRKKNILVNEAKQNSNYRISINDQIKILNFNEKSYKNFEYVKKQKLIPKKLKEFFINSIIFENENFIILDKWPGIATQGGSGINISIDNIIKNISSSYNLVHRLDKETSGLLIIAKNIEYTKIFGQMFKKHEIEKKYIAICEGRPQILESSLEFNIQDNNKKDKINLTKTYYKVLNYKNNISQILFAPKTGKKHQLRIASKKLSCPIIGDQIYNKQKIYKNEKLKLNACFLKFIIKNHTYEYRSTIPKDFNNFLKKHKLKITNLKKI